MGDVAIRSGTSSSTKETRGSTWTTCTSPFWYEFIKKRNQRQHVDNMYQSVLVRVHQKKKPEAARGQHVPVRSGTSSSKKETRGSTWTTCTSPFWYEFIKKRNQRQHVDNMYQSVLVRVHQKKKPEAARGQRVPVRSRTSSSKKETRGSTWTTCTSP